MVEEILDEETKDVLEAEEARRATAFVSPEAFIMLPIALIIDAIGIILILFGLDDFFITDIIGLIFIGGWSFMRSQIIGKTTKIEIPSPGRKAEIKDITNKTTKAAKLGRRLRWLRPLFICLEIIPYSGAFFWWTLLVIFELKR